MISRARVAWIVLLVYWIALMVATHLPPRHVPRTHVNDKIEHLVAYGILATLLTFAMPRTSSPRTFAIVVVVCLLYGAFDELTQPYFGRSCELNDWLADATGTIVASLICLFVARVCRRVA